jgi:hypothetical protein
VAARIEHQRPGGASTLVEREEERGVHRRRPYPSPTAQSAGGHAAAPRMAS